MYTNKEMNDRILKRHEEDLQFDYDMARNKLLEFALELNKLGINYRYYKVNNYIIINLNQLSEKEKLQIDNYLAQNKVHFTIECNISELICHGIPLNHSW